MEAFMELLERARQQATGAPAGSAADVAGQGAERVAEASRLLQAGRNAVDKALSNSPDLFLRQVRQQGGQ
jgi:hypothetical protein